MELKDRTIIITGASSGIGAAAARVFGAAGANLVIGARRAERLEAVAAEVRDKGGRVVVVPVDVRDRGHAERMVDSARSEFGGLDGAFNNAGIVGEMMPMPKMTDENWDDLIATNLTSAFLAARSQIPALAERGGGSIVFTSSFVGVSNGGLPGMGAYAATKAGLVGLVKSIAPDHAAEGIRINALLPGGTITPAGGEGQPEVLEFVAGLHPMKRLADPREIAEAALFLLSDRSSFMTGSAMLVDGGVSTRLA